MRILILGGDGMLGHQLLQSLSVKHQVKVTLRQSLTAYNTKLFNANNAFTNVDILQYDCLLPVLNIYRPEAVINAVGVIKQRDSAKESIPSITINALFPHRLAELCLAIGARLIHFSTDCVFSGRKGYYDLEDLSDAEDLYGKTKFLGELHDQHCVTIRSSIIGLELAHKKSLIEWFLAQNEVISGYKRAIYSGVTTLEMSRIVDHILLKCPNLFGVWQVASKAISKFELLKILAKKLEKDDIIIEPNETFFCDRSLNGEKFFAATQHQIPAWENMLAELAIQIKKREGVLV